VTGEDVKKGTIAGVLLGFIASLASQMRQKKGGFMIIPSRGRTHHWHALCRRAIARRKNGGVAAQWRPGLSGVRAN